MNNKQAEQTIVYNNILSNKKDAVLCFVDPYNVDLATKCVSFMELNNGWEHVCDCGYLGHLNGDWSLSLSVLIYIVAPLLLHTVSLKSLMEMSFGPPVQMCF